MAPLAEPHGQNENAANRPDLSPMGRPVLMVGGVARCCGARHWTPNFIAPRRSAVSLHELCQSCQTRKTALKPIG